MPNLIELAQRLHEEKLFVKSEQDTILKLNEQVRLNAEKLSHSFWITRHHYLNLHELISKLSSTNPAACSRRANELEKIEFVDAHEELGYDESSRYARFLESFINNPTLAAACLTYGDKLSLENTSQVAQIIVLGCYGNSIIADDHKHLLELLESLMLIQIAEDDQPRRLIQKGRCAFSVVYNLFAESLLPGKLFLMSALHEPIMKVLMEQEMCLETDEQKMVESVGEAELERRFGGKRGSVQFGEKLQRLVKENEARLGEVCIMFVTSLVNSMSLFPQSLGWVIARAYHIVKDAGNVSQQEAKALSADFLLQHFICPAIVDPERYGITGNLPVSTATRNNLMQVAQILQMAAHDTTTSPVNSSFDQTNLVKRRMKELIDVVISTCNNEGVPHNRNMHGHITSAIFLTSTQIAHIVLFLRQIQLSNVHGVDQTSLAKILSYLPNNPPPPITKATNSILQTSVNNVQVQDDLGVGGGAHKSSSHHQHQHHQQTSKQQPASSSATSTPQMSSSPSGRKLFAKSNSKHHHYHHHQHNDTSVSGVGGGGGGNSNSADEDNMSIKDDKVLVLSVNIGDDNQTCDQPPGMMSEQQVVEMYAAAAKRSGGNNDDDNSNSFGDTSANRKQFSVYLEGSNISEIGEIADATSQLDGSGSQSGRSGSSSIDLDQVGDQVGDDASSFIAGGSSSHGGNHDDDDDNDEDDDEADDLESVKRSSNDEALKDLRRKIPTSRESIEDKMRKFEIRKSRGGEVASTSGAGGGGGGGSGGVQQNSDARSETWSVDVYASDSEQNNDDHHIRRSSASMGSLLQQQPPHQPPQPLGGANNPPHGNNNNASSVAPGNQHQQHGQQQQANNSAVGGGDLDSRSDIWSVEVLASDGEPPSVDYRLNELDEDDDVTTRSRGSRASTPGLSAASGYSAVSGLSLVSDHNKSEPFSSLTPLVAGASSSGHQQQQAMTSHQHDDSSNNGGDHQQHQHQQQQSNSNNKNKSVAWNLPTTSKSSGDMTSLVGLESGEGEESGGGSGTIKRSPYKRASSTNNTVAQRKPPSQPRHVWIDQHDFAVPPEGAPAADIDVREFDPLATAASSSSNPALQPTTKPINNNEIQQNTTEQPTTTVVNTALQQQQQQQVPRIHPTSSTKSGAIERKKSSSSPWWKTHKFGKSMRSSKHSSGSTSKQVSRSSSDVSANNDLLMMVHEDEKPASSSAAPGEDIMEKYMRKMSTTPQHKSATKSTNYDNTLVEVDSKTSNDADNNMSSAPTTTSNSSSSSSANNNNTWQQHNSSKKKDDEMYGTKEEVRKDVKRKLRIVLSMAQPSSSSSFASQHNNLIVFSASSLSSPAHNAPPTTSTSSSTASGKNARVKIRDEILSLVQGQLSQALVLQDRERVAQLTEVKRCVRNIDNSQCEVVYSELWRDYNRRSPYIAYLIRTKQHLLTACSYFKSVEQSIDNDKAVCRRYFTHQCVRLFLKSRDQRVEIFQRQFSRLVASDDKVNKIGEFLRELYGHLVSDRVWQGTSEEVFNEAKFSIERYLFTTVYNTAMFPNQEADISRDQLFSEHIARLQESITPQHQALQISERFLSECPWKEAQVEAQSTVTYVTPRDKLRAATRCCKTIMYLLKIADENQVPGADDFTPVLVYVLIMANPRHLLSTIQFVRSYIGDELCGEDSYWWMQFTAATQFIKTI